MIGIRIAERLGQSGVGSRRIPRAVGARMVQFADVLSQVGTEPVEAPSAAAGVRVNTAGWDSWLKTAPDAPPPSPGSLYLDEETFEAPESEPVEERAPQREEILRSAYTGPEAAARETISQTVAPPDALDLGVELARTRLEQLTDPELRALRRRLARRVHPDLPDAEAASSGAMAQVNVAIDTVLRDRRPKRTPPV